MSVATLRAQFGLLPPGDPYGNPAAIAAPGFMQGGIYSVVAARNNPLPLQRGFAALIAQSLQIIYFRQAALCMRDRFIPYHADPKTPFVSTGPCPNPPSPVNVPINTSGSIGAPVVGAIGGVSAALGPVGLGIGAAASLISQIICTQGAQQAAQFDKAVCQISATLTKLLAILDGAVGLGQYTPDQAGAAWDTYAQQAAGVLDQQSVAATCTLAPVIGLQIVSGVIKCMGDFSKNFLWPDLYAKAAIARPATPPMLTTTSAPANEIAQSVGAPPASTVPAVVDLNMPQGSPRLAAVQPKAVAAPPAVVSTPQLSGALLVGAGIIAALFFL